MAAKKKTGTGRPTEAKPADKLRKFIVEEGFTIMGFDGEEKHSGDSMSLSQAQAKHFQKLGAITLDMEELFDEPDTAKDTAKSSAEPETDGPRKLNL